MSHHLPTTFPAGVVPYDTAALLPSLPVALAGARRFFEAEPAARSLEVQVVHADGRVALHHVGRRGGHRRLRTLGWVGGHRPTDGRRLTIA